MEKQKRKNSITIEEFIDSISREKMAVLVSMYLDEIARRMNKRVENYRYLSDLIEDFIKHFGFPLPYYFLADIEDRVFAEFEYKYEFQYGEITSKDEDEFTDYYNQIWSYAYDR